MGIFQVYYLGIHQLQHEMKMHFKYFQPKNAPTIKLPKNQTEIKVERQTKGEVGGRFKWFFNNIANGEWVWSVFYVRCSVFYKSLLSDCEQNKINVNKPH